MFRREGNKLVMTCGDYGVVLPVRIKSMCEVCGKDILPGDVIRVMICKDGNTLVLWETTWSDLETEDGVVNMELTPDQSAQLTPGLYTWHLALIRPGEVYNTLRRMVLEVVG